jgi:hypothetical protein
MYRSALLLAAILALAGAGEDPVVGLDRAAVAAVCDDATFFRRLHLDAAGVLPSPQSVRAFLTDRKPDRRERAIDGLLASPAYADWWAWRWSDLLRVKAEFPSNLWPLGAVATHRWLRQGAALPYDRFVAGLVTASGSGFRDGAVGFYRAIPERTPHYAAEAVELVFLGRRHDGPPDPAFTACFAGLAFKATGEWKEEILWWNPALIPAGTPAPCAPDGSPLGVAAGADPRPALAAWLSGPGRLELARALVNRTWSWLTGAGLVEPVDDLRAGNPPSDPALLDHLAGVLIDAGWDHRALMRAILRSRTWQAAAGGPEGYRIRRLSAEVLLDALSSATGSAERWTSPIPEPFTVIPALPAVALPDGSISCTFLEVFGRPGRASALAAERSDAPSVLQAQRLLTSTQVQQKIARSGWLKRLAGETTDPADELWLRFLCRLPDAAERARCAAALAAAPDRRSALDDLAWALLNITEFSTAH